MSVPIPRYAAPRGGRLSPEMATAFQEAGVLVLEDFVTESACQRLRERAGQLIDEFEPPQTASVFSASSEEHRGDRYFMESGDKIRFFFEAEAFDDTGQLRASRASSLNKIGHAMHDLDPVFESFSYAQEIGRIASLAGVTEPAIIQSMYILKPPRIGGEVHWHQDSTYIYTEPDSCLGFWFALEDATTENGCMYFIPGAHHEPLRERNVRTGELTTKTVLLDHTPFETERMIAAEARAGTLVLFHGRMPHMSTPNRSLKSRHAYTLHVIDQACVYPDTNWLRRGPELPLRSLVPVS